MDMGMKGMHYIKPYGDTYRRMTRIATKSLLKITLLQAYSGRG